MIYGGLFNMLFFTLDYVIEKTKNQNLNAKQLFLKRIAGASFSKPEAEHLWNRIEDHKWYVSEKLGRDIGFKVAAIDYFENINQTKTKVSKKGKLGGSSFKVYETLSLS
jgi:hypothetical protein